MLIFNRNGIRLFESNDINTGWDGSYKGEMVTEGVYVYKIRFKPRDKKNSFNYPEQ